MNDAQHVQRGDTATPASPSGAESVAFTPGRINGLELRNRVIKTATYEGMCPGGLPSQALTDHHVELARGGVGMTTVAYCAVSPRGRTFADQMAMSEALVPHLRRLTDAVHEAGAAVSIQLGHCGGFSKNTEMSRPHPLGPSRGLNHYGMLSGLVFTTPMSAADIDDVVREFADAARLAKESGFDAVELHLGHGYLLSQWLSPATNRRRDEHGGSLENRLRLPLAVVAAVREAVGPDFPILAKANLTDGFRGGATVDDAVTIAQALERGGVDALVMSGGFVSRTPLFLLRGGRPLKGMIEVEKKWAQKAALAVFGPVVVRKVPFEELFFLEEARRVRAAVSMPLVLLGGVISRAGLATAMREGFEFVAMGRALIADPAFVNEMRAGRLERTRCNQCNECMVEMDRGGVRCVLDALVRV